MAVTGEQLGLRERKKLQTRQSIADRAMELFLEHGFDNVSVADVARAAEVSDKTVFNYFATKENLFYSRFETFEAELLESIRDRPPGESFAAAFRRFLLGRRGLLGKQDADAHSRLVKLTRTVVSSRALLAREEEIRAGYTASLAALIAEETGARNDDVRPRVVANALMGVHRALIDYTRERVLEGAENSRVARGVRAQADKALTLLEQGLGDYGSQ